MVEEIFDDGEKLTPEQEAAFSALMFGTGVLKLSRTPEGKVEVSHIPIHDIHSAAPKDKQ